jgi:hypothetical protein
VLLRNIRKRLSQQLLDTMLFKLGFHFFLFELVRDTEICDVATKVKEECVLSQTERNTWNIKRMCQKGTGEVFNINIFKKPKVNHAF